MVKDRHPRQGKAEIETEVSLSASSKKITRRRSSSSATDTLEQWLGPRSRADFTDVLRTHKAITAEVVTLLFRSLEATPGIKLCHPYLTASLGSKEGPRIARMLGLAEYPVVVFAFKSKDPRKPRKRHPIWSLAIYLCQEREFWLYCPLGHEFCRKLERFTFRLIHILRGCSLQHLLNLRYLGPDHTDLLEEDELQAASYSGMCILAVAKCACDQLRLGRSMMPLGDLLPCRTNGYDLNQARQEVYLAVTRMDEIDRLFSLPEQGDPNAIG